MIKTVRLKPNPTGKDRTRDGRASATQLGAEWVDIQNTGAVPLDITGMRLCHVAYSQDGRSKRWADITTFTGTLGAGKVLRVHSGGGPENILRPEDLNGADHHLFTGRNYVWNNDKDDCSGLFAAGNTEPFDVACYDAFPPEGVVLVRMGNKLVPAGVVAARR